MQNSSPSSTFTAKQSRFIDEYMVDMNGAAAAERAGYSQKTSRSIACELLTKPDIQAELQARGAALARELAITREGVIQGLLDAFEMARADRQPSVMVSAMAAVAKLMGFYAPEVKKVDLNLTGQVEMGRLNQMTDQQLLDLMAAG